MQNLSINKFLSRYPRNERVLLLVATLYLVVHLVSNVWGDFRDNSGLELLVAIAPNFLYPVAILYALIRRERGLYGIAFAFIAMMTIASSVLLIYFANIVGIGTAFSNPSLRVGNCLTVAEIVLAIPVLIIMSGLLRSIYSERRKLRTMNDADLRSNFVHLARQIYVHWKSADLEKRHQTLGLLASIHSEFKRRDPTLANLSALLAEPDDWVRITTARYVLEINPEAALNTLDTIAANNTEGSSYAKDVARMWRDGTLVRWN